MTITTVTLVDDAEKTITQTTDTVLKSISTSTVWKPGSVGFNYQDLLTKAQNARANNAAFLAIASPTQAQAITQVQALTRQVDALILFNLASFSDTSGT